MQHYDTPRDVGEDGTAVCHDLFTGWCQYEGCETQVIFGDFCRPHNALMSYVPCPCGWDYPAETLAAAARGEVIIDTVPTHLCTRGWLA